MRIQLMGRRGPHQREDKGATAIIVAMMTIVLFGLTAFAVDIAMAFANVRSVQNGTDAAALAVARKIAAEVEDQTCAEIETAYTNDTASQSVADEYFKENVPAARASSPTASVDDIKVECEEVYSESVNATIEQVVVHVSGSLDSPVIFGGVVGATEDSIGLTRVARAIVGPAGSVMGLRPFAVCQTDAQALIALGEGGAVTLAFTNKDESPSKKDDESPEDPDEAICNSASGNWGLLDLSGGGGGMDSVNKCDDFQKAKEALICWIRDGYPEALSDPMSLPAQTGNSFTAAETEIESIINEEIAVPVFDKIFNPKDDEKSPSGNQSIYNVIDYIGIKICAYQLGGGSGRGPSECGDPAEWNARTSTYSELKGGGSVSYIQIMYTKPIVVGDLATCSFGSLDCNTDVRVVKLAD